MSRRQRPKRPQPTLRQRERQARAAIQRRKDEEAERQAQADSIRIASTTADVDAKMRRLARERAEHALAADRAEARRRIEHRAFLREHGNDIARNRQGLVADAMINTLDDPQDIEPMASLSTRRPQTGTDLQE